MRTRQIQTTRIAIALLALAGCLFFSASRTEAAPTNGKIAFQSQRDGNDEIYVMNPDGTGQVNISNNPFEDFSPNWSPNGLRIAFRSDRDGNDEIYVMNADGSNVTRLTFNTALDQFPAWSPDGTKIAFQSARDGNFEIYVMNADGTNQTRLTNNSSFDGDPQWSPDGTKIVFVSSRDGNQEIYAMNANGTGQTRLTNNTAFDEFPFFSPDGTKIAFQRNAQILMMNADGTNNVQLTFISTNFNPAFSPDGTKIVFGSARDGGIEIYVMDANGANQTRLTNNPAADFSPNWAPGFPPDTIGVFRPSTGQWLLRNFNSAGRANLIIDFGQAGDLPITGDWNGDGITDLGVFRNGQFLLRQSPTTITTVSFGQAGDLPVAGDWNGDGKDDVGVFRNGQFLLRKPVKPCPACPIIFITSTFNFGQAGDLPIAGDWNLDGIDSVGVYRNGQVFMTNSTASGTTAPIDLQFDFGLAGFLPLAGDWNGDGVDTIGANDNQQLVTPNPTTTFFLRNSNTTGVGEIQFTFGAVGDLPVAGDWDGKAANTPPDSGVNNPAEGSSRVGQTQVFTTTCSDPDGWHDIQKIDFKIGKSRSAGRRGDDDADRDRDKDKDDRRDKEDCNDDHEEGSPVILWVRFDENRNVIRFYDPDLETWREGVPGANIVLESRFASLYLAGTTVQGSGPSGPSVQITWKVVFKEAAKGSYKQFLRITDDAGLSTGFDRVGSWKVKR